MQNPVGIIESAFGRLRIIDLYLEVIAANDNSDFPKSVVSGIVVCPCALYPSRSFLGIHLYKVVAALSKSSDEKPLHIVITRMMNPMITAEITARPRQEDMKRLCCDIYCGGYSL